jgi:hypothetical protein
MAAVLAHGPGAVLSHRSAAALWELRPSARVEVTAERSRVGLAGIVVHRARTLDPRDAAIRDGIPVTAVARTLLDLAEVLRPRQLERAVDEAERLRMFDLNAIQSLCRRSPGRHGLRPLIALLGETFDAPPATKSELERMFFGLCRDGGLPLPVANAWVAGVEVDAHWPGTDLVVELDGYAFHRTRGAFERDHARDLRLQLAGYRVLRLTYGQLTGERAEVTATIRALLGSSRKRPALDPGARARALP